jgi:hypothetical protein
MGATSVRSSGSTLAFVPVGQPFMFYDDEIAAIINGDVSLRFSITSYSLILGSIVTNMQRFLCSALLGLLQIQL